MFKSCGFAAVVLSFGIPFASAQQIQPGAGNTAAVALAQKSPEVQSAYNFLLQQAQHLKNGHLRNQTLDALFNPRTFSEGSLISSTSFFPLFSGFAIPNSFCNSSSLYGISASAFFSRSLSGAMSS